MASHCCVAVKNWPSLEAEAPMPQDRAIGNAACASTTMASAGRRLRLRHAIVQCESLPEGVGVRGVGHLAQTEVDPFRKDDVHQPDPVGAGRSSVRRCVNASVKLVAASTSNKRLVMRVGGMSL